MNRADLRTAIRRHADMVNSPFVSDAELNALIDIATGDLYDVLVEAFGDEYFGQTCWIKIDNGSGGDNNVAWPNPTYRLGEVNGVVVISSAPTPDGGLYSSFALPPSFLRLLRAEFVVGVPSQTMVTINHTDPTPDEQVRTSTWILSARTSQRSIPMHRIDGAGQWIDTEPREWVSGCVAYRLRHGPHRIVTGTTGDAFASQHNGTLIDFLPVPRGNYAVCITYVPKATLLTNDTDQFPYEYVEHVAYSVAAQCLDKQESDSRMWRGMLAQTEARIKGRARTPDAANPPMVTMHGARGRVVRKGDGFPWR